MLYGTADGEGADWYSTHLAKLMNEKIITNDNPQLKELRGYVMIMLMRSAKQQELYIFQKSRSERAAFL